LQELPEFQNYSCFSLFLLLNILVKMYPSRKIQFCYFNYNFLKVNFDFFKDSLKLIEFLNHFSYPYWLNLLHF
jgi:hypothetical protein